MNKFKVFLGALVLAAGGLGSMTASAATICNGCTYQGDATYLGSHDPTQGDGSTFTSILGTGSFEDIWLFEIDPEGAAAINATFIPSTAVSNFALQLFSATPTCTIGAAGSICTTPGVGSLVGTATTSPDFLVNLEDVFLTAGYYAFVVTGDVAELDRARSYSGNLTTTEVPEPATLALLGLGLVGFGAARRRRS